MLCAGQRQDMLHLLHFGPKSAIIGLNLKCKKTICTDIIPHAKVIFPYLHALVGLRV